MVSRSVEAGLVSPVVHGVGLAVSADEGVEALLDYALVSLLGVRVVTLFADVCAVSDLVSGEREIICILSGSCFEPVHFY